MKIRNIFLVLAIILNFTMPPLALAYHYEKEHSHSNYHHHESDVHDELDDHEHECDSSEYLGCEDEVHFLVNNKFIFEILTEQTQLNCKKTRQIEHKTLVELHIKLNE